MIAGTHHTKVIRKESERKEIEREMLLKVLMDLLRDEENRYCADCEAKGPRWASWNHGVFVCIRCAGIHRKLGVHISKVKSINLDSWTPEQVQSMCCMGNSVAKAVYENTLPEHFRRPATDQALEAFIRAKYEHKRYLMKDWQRPDADVKNLCCYNELMELRQNGTVRTRVVAPQQTTGGRLPPPVKAPAGAAAAILPPGNTQQRPAEKQTSNALSDLVDLTIDPPASTQVSNVNDLLSAQHNDDPFGDFMGATATAPTAAHHFQPSPTAGQNEAMFFSGSAAPVAAAPTPTGGNEKKTNQDILALFGSASSTAPAMTANGGMSGYGAPPAAYGAPPAAYGMPAHAPPNTGGAMMPSLAAQMQAMGMRAPVGQVYAPTVQPSAMAPSHMRAPMPTGFSHPAHAAAAPAKSQAASTAFADLLH